ncbi:hypothetical protein SAY86_008028 [Trapa natans]|uniref:Nucleoside phosphorylase domain-containing protein n=1 Tax=Trapa natans TaxID=22666 RepID=A0AAN7LFI8_TRANT|nr:hypothetical protein SAY86_008028 [Trapa natans]
MAAVVRWAMLLLAIALGLLAIPSEQAFKDAASAMPKIQKINSQGPYLGIISPNTFELNPLLNSSSYSASTSLPYLDILGRRFRFGKVHSEKVIIVMTGLSMLNAGITTQLLLALFNVKGVLHYGIAGNANPSLQIGDVAIPEYWAHTGLWNWQRYGDGPDDELALEDSGDYTRKLGYLKISNYTVNEAGNGVSNAYNLLNNVWYQPEEIFPVDGTPEERQHAFWVRVDDHYYGLSAKLLNMTLAGCVNSTTCLPRTPRVHKVGRGISANVYLDNKAYRTFIRSKFNVTPVDMESAAVALVCRQQKMPFITFRAMSDLAGGGTALSNEASTFSSLAAQNSVDVLVEFISLVGSSS